MFSSCFLKNFAKLVINNDFGAVGGKKKAEGLFSNPQKITCIIFETLFGPYFLPHQSHSYGYAPSSGENLSSKMSFKSDATYYFHIT